MGDQTFSAAAANDECATIYVAIELSRKNWLMGLRGPLSKMVGQHKLYAGDAAGLLALIRRKRAELKRKLGQEIRVMSCDEAGYDGF